MSLVNTMKARFTKVSSDAKAAAPGVQHTIRGWYSRHGHWVRAGTNVGVVAAGVVLATSVKPVVAGIGVGVYIIGCVGTGFSACEIAARSFGSREAGRIVEAD